MLEHVLIVGRGPVASFLVDEYMKMGVTPIIAAVEGDNWWNPNLGLEIAWLKSQKLNGLIKEIANVASEYKRRGIELIVDPVVSPHFAENPQFPYELMSRGIRFAGPVHYASALASDKIEMRHVAREAGVPLMPWDYAPIIEDVLGFAQKAGYPIMLKETTNGGGRGTRKTDNEGELRDAFNSFMSRLNASNEHGLPLEYLVAGRVNGDLINRLFVEKALEDRRHIEVQFLVDGTGNIYCFGTRDCSEQRNFQKMIELAPANISAELEQRLIEDGVKIIRGLIGKSSVLASNDGNFMFNPYRGAITVEYIVDSRDNHYFIETNGRYQVEAAVSIMSTVENLVWYRWEVAKGNRLKMDEGQHVKMFPAKYHVIESRITAEHYDPATGAFRPSPGLVTGASFPIHTDLAVHSSLRIGEEVPYQFDPHVVSMLARGRTMREAMELMMDSLQKIFIVGIDTTVQYHIGRLNDALRNGTTPSGMPLSSLGLPGHAIR